MRYRHGDCQTALVAVCVQAPDDAPVWRQLLQHHRDHSNPEVAQQAAAALAGLTLKGEQFPSSCFLPQLASCMGVGHSLM